MTMVRLIMAAVFAPMTNNLKAHYDGANRADFVHKLAIALKETHETTYWLDLLMAGEYLDAAEHESIKADADELVKLLTSIIKSTKAKV